MAVGPWWRTDGRDQIDAVALAEPQRTRIPVLVGESKWAKTANAARLRARLFEKAASLTTDRDDLRYAICARGSITHATPDILAVTAADIFTGAGG